MPYKYGTQLPTDYDEIDSSDNIDTAGYPKNALSRSDSFFSRVRPTPGLDLSETSPYGFTKTPTIKDLAFDERSLSTPTPALGNAYQNIEIPRRYSALMPSQIQPMLPSARTEAIPLGVAPAQGMPSEAMTSGYAPVQPPQSQQEFVNNVVSPQTQKKGFFDWFKNMPEDKKQALNMGLLSAGLNMMSAGGRTYDRPISGLALLGDAGQQGLNTYQEQNRYNQNEAMKNAYLGFAKQAATQSQEKHAVTLPFASETLRSGLTLEKAQIKRLEADAEAISLKAAGQGKPDTESIKKGVDIYSGLITDIIKRQMPVRANELAALANDPVAYAAKERSIIEELRIQLNKPENKEEKLRFETYSKALDDLTGIDTTASGGLDIRQPNTQKAQYVANGGYVSGMLESGNIDIANRPQVGNEGKTSTVRSIGVNMDGKEYLIPTVSDDGQLLSNEEAINLFKKTRKHLGVFKNAESSKQYAGILHEDQAQRLQTTGGLNMPQANKIKPYTQDDVKNTAVKYGLTEKEVIRRLEGQ